MTPDCIKGEPEPAHPSPQVLLPVTMSQPTFTLNDGNKIPFLAFGTGTSLSRQDVTEPVSLAIEKGFTHLDGAQVCAHNHRSVDSNVQGRNPDLSE